MKILAENENILTPDQLLEFISAGKKISRILSSILSEENLREEQWRTLHLLSIHSSLLIGDLPLHLGIPHASITRIIDDLSGKGLVFRKPAPHDGRKVYLYLSRMGQIKHLRSLDLIHRHRLDLSEYLSPKSIGSVFNEME